MRDFIITDITGGNKAPFSKRSLEHLNEMTSELGTQVLSAITNNKMDSNVIILSGCEITGSQPGVISYTAGTIYYLGDIYNVDANGSLTINIGEVGVWEIIDTTITGDPATFSDTNTYDFHRIRKMRLVSGTTGSGLADYDDAKLFNKIQQGLLFGTPVGNTANITTITTNSYMLRSGRNVTISALITVNLSVGSAEIDISLPLLNTEENPLQSSVVYPSTGTNYGSIANRVGVSMPLCSGYVVVDSINNQLNVKWTCVSAETTHQVLMQVSYTAELPYAKY